VILKVQTHHIRQILHKLNLEGLVSQKKNKAPHDSKRDFWGGHDSSWMPSLYTVKLEEFNALQT
jgi:predicted transcriptional regulator